MTMFELLIASFVMVYIFLATWGVYTMCYKWWAEMLPMLECQRIARTNPNTGERSYLTDAERPAEIANAQKAVTSWCKR